MSNKNTLHKVLLGLGSNLGNKKQNIEQALLNIQLYAGETETVSSLYETDPVGFESVNRFINAVCIINTVLSPEEVLDTTKKIEKKMGRTIKSEKKIYSDRIIDIDILFYDNDIIQTPELIIPHPLVHTRDFVLRPLSEIAPYLIHPVLNKSIDELCKNLNKQS